MSAPKTNDFILAVFGGVFIYVFHAILIAELGTSSEDAQLGLLLAVVTLLGVLLNNAVRRGTIPEYQGGVLENLTDFGVSIILGLVSGVVMFLVYRGIDRINPESFFGPQQIGPEEIAGFVIAETQATGILLMVLSFVGIILNSVAFGNTTEYVIELPESSTHKRRSKR